MKRLVRILGLLMLACVLTTGSLSACRRKAAEPGQSSAASAEESTSASTSATEDDGSSSTASSSSGSSASTSASPIAAAQVDPNGSYDDLEHVVLYLEEYGELPHNYVTKAEARAAGWQGGSPSPYIEGSSIGGDYFGNYEELLPQLARGSEYHECDLDTTGASSRGAHRLIYTDDGDASNGCGPYYYTQDHYESFAEVEVVDGEVIVHE